MANISDVNVSRSVIKVTANVLGLDAGREIEAQKFNLPQLPNSIPNVEDCTKALLAFKPMLADVLSRINF